MDRLHNFIPLVVAGCFALSMIQCEGSTDVPLSLSWMHDVSTVGPIDAYKLHNEYPPGAHWLLGAVAAVHDAAYAIAGLLGFEPAVEAPTPEPTLEPAVEAPTPEPAPLAESPSGAPGEGEPDEAEPEAAGDGPGARYRTTFKWFMLLCVFAAAGAAYRWKQSPQLAAVLVLTVSVNAVGLGYLDICTTATLILALAALERGDDRWFAIWYSASVLVKWQPIIMGPFLLLHLLGKTDLASIRQIDWPDFRQRIVKPFVIIWGVVFLMHHFWMLSAFSRVFIPFQLSSNAMNLPWLVGVLLGVESAPVLGPVAIIALPLQLIYWASMLLVLWRYVHAEKTLVNLLFFATAGYCVYFILNVGVHENHFYMGAVVSVLLYGVDNRYWWLALAVALSANFSAALPFPPLALINPLGIFALLIAIGRRRLPLPAHRPAAPAHAAT